MYFSKLIKSNESANALQASQRAVVAGGTQGIGAGIALRFALAGASVWIIGRSEERGQEVMKKLQQASQEATRRRHSSISSSNDDQNQDSQAQHAFIRADLSDVDEVKRVVEVVKERAGSRGIEWLFETQGSTPTGNISNTAKGLDSHFAVQCLSRFGLASSLLQSGTVKQSVCLIAAPGGGSSTPLSYKDLELKQAKASSWGMMKMVAHGQRDASVIDAFTQHLAEQYPSISISHLSPGVVGTNVAVNSGLSFPIPQMLAMASYILPSAEQYSSVPFYLHANPQGSQYLEKGKVNLLGPSLQRYDISKNVATKEARQSIVDGLNSYGFGV